MTNLQKELWDEHGKMEEFYKEAILDGPKNPLTCFSPFNVNPILQNNVAFLLLLEF